ncbi:ABC-type glycerol-3-phosphate transport system substrate-binding protein [Mobilisporobacter senegalensis]|uniref:ABC-type glycerol-3-phosphate transport system substrate-binding protein n=1 Tax=Mobilisporobacter senegalensis TaxID=1329262 RepID=A0A3N1XSS9_9FIRM|nr:ABC transporter substrate-binding protein [Mobilisporobacter senegalensis]ROR29308.1 ABC-type glycerol-3-phosphate transport system substrate-binding protein [Mobilisporobacter senegalensis]
MKKRIMALALTAVLVLGSLTACGKDDSKDAATKTDEVAETNKESDETDQTDTGKEKFYIWSWNDEFQGMMENFFLKDHPEYKDKYDFQYVITGTDAYQEKLDLAFEGSGAEDAPDLLLLEADYIKKYVSSDNTLKMDDLGITAADYPNQYNYTVTTAQDERDNSQKGLSWQAAPGEFIYRRSLAKKYLGTDDPAKVQEMIKDWDSFLEVARKISKESGGATKMLSGPDDAFRPYMSARTSAWVKDGKLTVDPKMEEYLEFNKILETEGLTNGTTQWSDAWAANAGNDSTFGYFGSTWFVQWTLMANAGDAETGTYGDWAMTQGPQWYYWGGTWVAAGKECSNKDLAAEIIRYFTCDEDAMYNYSVEKKDYVNNTAAIKRIIDDGKGTFDFLGNQEYYKIFAETADQIDTSIMTAYDQKINDAFHVEAKAYATGEKDKETAIADFKSSVIGQFAELTE